MSGDTTSCLASHILSLADTKRLLGIRYSDWLLGAPTLEMGVAASSMTQAEWGHARLLYAMLKEFGFDPVEVERNRAPQAYHNLSVLDQPLGDWAAFIAAVVIIDGALDAALRSFSAGAFPLAQKRVPKMLLEEVYHRDLGASWFKRLAATTGEGRTRLLEATSMMVGPTVAWLAPDDAPYADLVSQGFVKPAAEVRSDFEGQVGPILAELGVDLSAVVADHGDWDEGRRRRSGAPSEDAIERARGDRNRALFVE